MSKDNHPNHGLSLEDFLKEEGTYEFATRVAIDAMVEEIKKLRERCESYKGQIESGGYEIEKLRSELVLANKRIQIATIALHYINTPDVKLPADHYKAYLGSVALEAIRALDTTPQPHSDPDS